MNLPVQIKQVFRQLAPLEMATKELIEAQRSLLESESAVEYAQSVVTYNKARIARLKNFVNAETTA